jgi:cbb3-type cytochrome oxidase maturation protein
MDVIVVLIPGAVALGAMGLAAFLWSLSSNQYEDLEGAAQRILIDDDVPPDSPA